MTAVQDRNTLGTLTVNEPLVGRFSYDVVADNWNWDAEVFAIHGLRPCSVARATEQVLAGLHPEDRARVCDTLRRARRGEGPLSASYRLSATDDVADRVLIVCEAAARGEDDSVTAVTGYFLGLRVASHDQGAEVGSQAVAAVAQQRFAIERAVGGLMAAYGLTADQAFAVLRSWSQEKNVKVRDLAGSLTEAASEGAASTPAIRRTFDLLLRDATEKRPPHGTVPRA